MRKLAYTGGIVLELALIAGAFALDYFSRARLGMNRWLGYHNRKWEENLPVPAIEVAVLALIAALLVLAMVLFARNARKRAIACVSIVVSIALLCVAVWFSASFSPTSVRAYYLIALCLCLASVLQVLQSIALAREK